MKITLVQAIDIPDAWFQCIKAINETGYRYKNEMGSYVGETRVEFDSISVLIEKPYAEPYDLMLPQIPAHLNIPNPVESGYVEQYMPYLMTDHKEKNEEYTYGSRIEIQYKYWIEIFKRLHRTNQAILQVADPYDFLLDDQPCLRHIDMKIKDGILHFYPYFRSWDLWSGFPANLAGIAVLQKYMADEIGVKSGSILAISKGLHIYGYVEELAKLRLGK